MDALTINAVDAAGRAVMSEVTREHKAGLELAKQELGAFNVAAKASADYCLDPLIAQASAAPELGAALTPAAYRTIDEFGSCTLSIGKIHQDSRALVLADHAERLIRFGRYEMERLQQSVSDLKGIQWAISQQRDAATQRADAAEQKLSEAQALLRDLMAAWESTEGHAALFDAFDRLHAVLSATAQPGEVKS